MANHVTIGLRVPATPAANDPDGLGRWAQEAEALGFDAIWVGDHVFHPVAVYHPILLLTWIAAQTRRVRLGTAVMLFAYRDPVMTAKELASLDRLSGGRVGPIGVSLGGTPAEYQALNVPMEKRVGRLRENFVVMKRLLTEESVSHQGKVYSFQHARINPQPVQKPRPPLWLGGSHPAAFRRAVELADGWIATAQVDAADLLRMTGELRQAAREQGRDPDDLGYGKLLSVAVAGDRETARAQSEAHLGAYYSGRFNIDRYCVFGTPAEVRTGVAEYCAPEVDRLALALEPPTLDLDALRRLADAVLPLGRG